MGLSSVFTVGMSALRYKLLALNLGPEGIGVLGLLSTTLALGVTLFGVGIGSSGIRQVAASQADEGGFGIVTRAALIRGSWLLGLLALIVGFLIFPFLRTTLFADTPALLIIWLILAIAASVVSSGQVALLNGLGRLSEIAKSNIFGAILGTGLTTLLLPIVPQWALAMAFAGSPLSVLAFTSWYARGSLIRCKFTLAELWGAFKPMLLFGLAFSGSLLLSSLVQVLLRVIVSEELDLKNTGYYQAAWTVASVYLGFVIAAMAAEYYPRISSIAHYVTELNHQVNSQIRIILLFATPLILIMILLAPIIMALMYAPEFTQATPLLRWQLLGDILKIASWPIGFLLLAREAKWRFFLSELIWNVSFLIMSALLIGPLGLKGLGLAYGCSYVFYFVSVVWFANRLTGYMIEGRIFLFVILSLCSGSFIEIFNNGNVILVVTWKIIIIISNLVVGIFCLGWNRDISRFFRNINLKARI
jgi:antigen flippase